MQYVQEYLQLLEEAKRPGRKSAAQNRTAPSERRSGSKKNRPGTSTKQAAAKIDFSDSVLTGLKNKMTAHNERSGKKVSMAQLKAVYRRGAGAYSSSHRPGKTRNQWAMARVNTFLRMLKGGKVKDSYRAADKDLL
jgi:hypothetical protein